MFVSDRRHDYLATATAQDAEALNLGVGITAQANGVVRRETGRRDKEQRAAKESSVRRGRRKWKFRG